MLASSPRAFVMQLHYTQIAEDQGSPDEWIYNKWQANTANNNSSERCLCLTPCFHLQDAVTQMLKVWHGSFIHTFISVSKLTPVLLVLQPSFELLILPEPSGRLLETQQGSPNRCLRKPSTNHCPCHRDSTSLCVLSMNVRWSGGRRYSRM